MNRKVSTTISSNTRKAERSSVKAEYLSLALRAIRSIDQLITKERDRDRLVKGACESLVEVCGYRSAWVVLMDKSHRIVSADGAGLCRDLLAVVEKLKNGELPDCGCRALTQSEVVITRGRLPNCGDCLLLADCCNNEAMTVRLEYGGNTYGVLTVILPEDLAADQGEQTLFEEVARDIAFALYSIALNEKQTMAEEALRESESHYSTLIGSLTDAVFEFKGGVLIWCNDRVEGIYGYTREELIGKDASFFLFRDINPSGFVREISTAIKERGVFRGTVTVKKKDGSLADIEYSISRAPTSDRGNVIIIARDITGRKCVEKERERLLAELSDKTRELEQIVYVSSHDLRSPLVNIQGFTRELEHAFKQVYEALNSKEIPSSVRHKLAPVLEEDIPQAFQYILASSSKMDTLLSGLLRLSRLGRAALIIKPVDMKGLVSNIVASFEFQIKESSATVTVGDLPACYCDETQINQVFSNLLDNALKFLDPGRPGIIRISGKEEKGQVIYCVEDNGIGIADKDKSVIFEIFRRLDPGSKTGEGLGLTIVRKILDHHGGKIWVESEPGKGSRFFVSLIDKCASNAGMPIVFGGPGK